MKKKFRDHICWLMLLAMIILCAGCSKAETANVKAGETPTESTNVKTGESTVEVQGTEEMDMAEQAGEDEKPKADFPIVLEDGNLTIESVFQYSGINFDYQEELCENIGAIQLKNTSEKYLESTDVTVELTDGEKLTFRIEDVPAGKTIIAFETSNHAFDGKQEVSEAMADVVWQENASLQENQISLTVEGTEIAVKNISNEAVKGLTLKYHCVLDGMYFGGKSYEGKVDALGVGESILLDAWECYLGEAAVVNVID